MTVRESFRQRAVCSPLVKDLRRWWLVAERPPSLRAWLRTHRLTAVQVPEDSARVRWLWRASNRTDGVVFFALSAAVLLLGGALRWAAMHPARRWTAIGVASAIAVWTVAT